MESDKSNEVLETPAPWMAVFILAVTTGLVWGMLALPSLAPGLAASLLGSSPKAYWFLARGSALVAFVLLWLAMALGMTITNRMARLWPGGPQAFDLHQFLSLLGLAFAVFHGLILLGDQYIGYSLAQLLIPFASASYKPVWVGLGQVGLYAWGLITLSFYVRKRIGNSAWRLIHFISYLSFGLAQIHGLLSGTDSGIPWVSMLYWLAGGSLFFLLIYRILNGKVTPAVKKTPVKTAAERSSDSGAGDGLRREHA